MTLTTSFQAYVALTDLQPGTFLTDEKYDEARNLRKSCLKAVRDVLEKNTPATSPFPEATFRNLKKNFKHVEQFLTSYVSDERNKRAYQISKARLVASFAAIERPQESDDQNKKQSVQAYDDALEQATTVEECQTALLKHAKLGDAELIKGLERACLKRPAMILDLACDDRGIMQAVLRYLVTNKRADDAHKALLLLPDSLARDTSVSRNSALSILAIEAYCQGEDATGEKCLQALLLPTTTCHTLIERLIASDAKRAMDLIKHFVDKTWLYDRDLLNFMEGPRRVELDLSLKIGLAIKDKELRLYALGVVAHRLIVKEKAFHPVCDLYFQIDESDRRAFLTALMERFSAVGEETLVVSIAHQAESATNFSGIVDEVRKALNVKRELSEKIRAELEERPIEQESSESSSSSSETEDYLS